MRWLPPSHRQPAMNMARPCATRQMPGTRGPGATAKGRNGRRPFVRRTIPIVAWKSCQKVRIPTKGCFCGHLLAAAKQCPPTRTMLGTPYLCMDGAIAGPLPRCDAGSIVGCREEKGPRRMSCSFPTSLSPRLPVCAPSHTAAYSISVSCFLCIYFSFLFPLTGACPWGSRREPVNLTHHPKKATQATDILHRAGKGAPSQDPTT